MKATHPVPAAWAAEYRRNGHWTDHLIGEQMAWAAAEFGDRTALVDGDQRLTYAEVEDRVRRVASALQARGVQAGDVVSCQLHNCVEAVVTFHAAVRIGAVVNPIVSIYRNREVGFVLRQARTKVAIIPSTHRGHDFVQMYSELRDDLPDLLDVVVVGDAAEHRATLPDGFTPWDRYEDGDAGALRPWSGDADDITMLLYTSGTTSDPKGVLHSHNTLGYDARAMIAWFGLNDRDIIFNPAPLTHAAGLLCGLMIPSLIGATLILQDQWDAGTALSTIVAERATFMLFATPFLQGLVDLPGIDAADLGSVRYVVCGGADIPPALMQRAAGSLGPVVRMYGASEVPSMTSSNRRDPVKKRLGTDGRWMLPTDAVLVDDEGRRQARDARGEVRITGPDVFLGYLDSDLNASAFDETGAFCSGDVGEMDAEGYLRIVGRIKDIINRAGEKFSAKETEDLLYEHPDIVDVAVVAVPDERTGERACAFIAMAPGRPTLSVAEVGAYLGSLGLSKRKFPEQVEIVRELPRTASGKVQKTALREVASHSPLPDMPIPPSADRVSK